VLPEGRLLSAPPLCGDAETDGRRGDGSCSACLRDGDPSAIPPEPGDVPHHSRGGARLPSRGGVRGGHGSRRGACWGPGAGTEAPWERAWRSAKRTLGPRGWKEARRAGAQLSGERREHSGVRERDNLWTGSGRAHEPAWTNSRDRVGLLTKTRVG